MYRVIVSLTIIAIFTISYVKANPLQLTPEEASVVEHFLTQLRQQAAEENNNSPGQQAIQYNHHRSRRQSEGLGEMFSGLGGRLSNFRESWRDTVRPIQEQLNPLPAVENFGKMLAEASSNTMTRGREAVQGIRDFGSRTSSRLRDGVSDAWEGLRDNWEEFWDL